jgi:hypothetical protein
MFEPNPFVYPQTSAKPIATNYLQDETASVEIVEKEASGTQRSITTGTALPIVFGRFQDNAGGVWVSPPAARVGWHIRDLLNSEFSFGLVISEGEIGPISAKDIFKGSFNLDDLINRSFSNAYGFMPTAGYDYSFSETVTTPGTPGTGDQVNTGTKTVTINQSTGSYINTSNYVTVFTRSTDSAININLSVTQGSSSTGAAFAWRILANNIVVANGTGTGSASGSYNAGKAVSWRIELKATSSSSAGAVQCKMTGTGTRITTTVIPGTPAVPPVYSTTGLPLFAGAGGNFIGMSCLAVSAEYDPESAQRGVREQVRCFVRNGLFCKNLVNNTTGSSSNFIDLAYYLLKVNKVSDDLIDIEGFREMRNFLEVNKIRYNGVLATSTNLREFFSAAAPGVMLKFVQDAGRFSFKPVLPLDADYYIESGSIGPAKTFNNDNIVAGSLRRSYYKTQLRKPFCVLLSWREQQRQKYSSVITSEFRYKGTAVDGPFETYDYSDFITDINHASLVANYILSSRARTTHSISFSTYLDGSATGEKLAGELDIMDIIRVQMTNDTGLDSEEFYQINSVTENADGQLDIEAIHFPSDSTGASLVAADVLASKPPAVPNPQPDGGSGGGGGTGPTPPSEGIGILSVSPTGYEYAAGMRITFTASYDGPAKDVTFNWFGPAGTGAPLSTTGPVLSWVSIGAADAGGYTVIAVSPTASDSGKRATAGLDYQPFYKMSGGTVTTDGNFKIHTFKTSGTLTIDFAPPVGDFEYLICGPGGGVDNNTNRAGGGGGGGVLTGNRSQVIGDYPVTVGVTGPFGNARTSANHSTVFGLTAQHGGDGSLGRVFPNVHFSGDGGCGGGARETSPYDTYRPGIGYQGGDGGRGNTIFRNGFDVASWSGGGGGASGANGTNGSEFEAGRGGEGVLSSISGTPYVYGSGGGGAMFARQAANGRAPGGTGAGSGGGSWYVGGTNTFFGFDPPTNYGAGASAANWTAAQPQERFQRGKEGIVIIRYQYK